MGIWKREPLGPGGFISGLSMHADGTKVCRMDTSGAYKWNASTSRWDMMVTANSFNGDVGSIPDAESIPGYGTNPGTYEIIIAPSNSARIYMMWAHLGDGRVWRSDNRGATFTKTARATDTFDANDNWRGAGRKMAVDPVNPDVVICGGPIGVTLSTDAGANWTTISTSSIPAPVGQGKYLFAFDPNSAVVSGKTQGIYCFSYGNGLYKSTNGGTTWALAASGGPTTCWSLEVSTAGKVFVTAQPSTDMTCFMLPSGGSWTTSQPSPTGVTSEAHNLLWVAVDPSNPLHVAALSEWGGLSFSSDAGVTWTGFATHHISYNSIAWLDTIYGGTGVYGILGTCLTFDPAVPGVLHQGHGLGTCKTSASWGQTTTIEWVDNSIGLEQLCSKRLVKPPGGLPVFAVMDQGMFRLDGVNYPTSKGVNNGFCAAWDTDYCPTDPLTIVGALNQSQGGSWDQSGISRDGGITWTQFSSAAFNTHTNAGAMVACGTDRNNFIINVGDAGATTNGIWYTTDGGANWALGSFPVDVPTSGDTGWLGNYYYNRHTICGDRVNADTFYARNGYTQKFYKSTNKGATWTEVNSTASVGTYANARLVSVPGNGGHLFYMSGPSGYTNFGTPLHRSTDGGTNWTSCAGSGVGEVMCMGFGKAPAGGYPALFIVGWVSGVYGVFRSDDNASTWTKIGDYPMGCFDTPVDITGDPDVYGDCYFAVGASGVFRYKFNTGNARSLRLRW